ncbi:MAG: DegT/DnrJ/EryC1/StrS family aminotransferase [Salinivirgaceae bacterium]
MDKKITVTQPFMPPLEEFQPYLQKIWENKWLTNNGEFHQQLEQELCEYLGVKYISLFANGALALMTALQCLRITGEVITTPFSFVATTHSLWWNNIKPVFVDIDPVYGNLDPDKIEAAITPQTTALMPVHVYGNPCQHDKIQRIAETYNLKLIYDAAHAFNVRQNGQSILNWGDLSVLSFHATKVFNTFEGGAIVCHDATTKKRIDDLKNFGIHDEVTVVAPGINAKMNEVQAAFGLLQLKYMDESIAKRKALAEVYRKELRGVKGLRFQSDRDGVLHNYSYFPVFISEDYPLSRDALYEKLKEKQVFTRRYFYPLISDFSTYRALPSAHPDNLPVAKRLAEQVLCLPIYPDLGIEEVENICSRIKNF